MENILRTPGWIKDYNSKLTSADEAVQVIKSGDGVYIQPGCAVPFELIRAMVRRKDELRDVKIYHILAVGKLLLILSFIDKI